MEKSFEECSGVENKREERYVSNEKYIPLSEKCIEYIKNHQSLSIDEANIANFVNEEILRRFMISKSYDEMQAFKMWKRYLKWKLQNKPELIKEEHIQNELKSRKAFIHGTDLSGRPCIVAKACMHIPENSDVEEVIRFTVYTVDKACRLAKE
jgi:hypothetical protein